MGKQSRRSRAIAQGERLGGRSPAIPFGDWALSDRDHLIRLIRKYGQNEVIAAAQDFWRTPDISPLVRRLRKEQQVDALRKRRQELQDHYKAQDKRNFGYLADWKLFEEVEDRKPTKDEVSQFRDRLKKIFRRDRERTERRGGGGGAARAIARKKLCDLNFVPGTFRRSNK